MVVVVRDLFKTSDELINRNFAHDKPWAIDFKHRLNNPGVRASLGLGSDGRVSSVLNTSLLTDQKIQSCLSLGLDSIVSFKASYPPTTVPGLTIGGQSSYSLSASEPGIKSASVDASLVRNPFHTKLRLDLCSQQWEHSLVCRRGLFECRKDSLAVGFEISGKNDLASLKTMLGASYTVPIEDKRVTVALKTAPQEKHNFGKIIGSIVGESSELGSALGTEVTYIPHEGRTEMSVAGAWYLNPAKKNTQVKAKIDQDGKIAAMFSHKISEEVQLTFGAEFDGTMTFQSEKGGVKPTRFGVKLNLLA